MRWLPITQLNLPWLTFFQKVHKKSRFHTSHVSDKKLRFHSFFFTQHSLKLGTTSKKTETDDRLRDNTIHRQVVAYHFIKRSSSKRTHTTFARFTPYPSFLHVVGHAFFLAPPRPESAAVRSLFPPLAHFRLVDTDRAAHRFQTRQQLLGRKSFCWMTTAIRYYTTTATTPAHRHLHSADGRKVHCQVVAERIRSRGLPSLIIRCC